MPGTSLTSVLGTHVTTLKRLNAVPDLMEILLWRTQKNKISIRSRPGNHESMEVRHLSQAEQWRRLLGACDI
jgi:hypothetical protein